METRRVCVIQVSGPIVINPDSNQCLLQSRPLAENTNLFFPQFLVPHENEKPVSSAKCFPNAAHSLSLTAHNCIYWRNPTAPEPDPGFRFCIRKLQTINQGIKD